MPGGFYTLNREVMGIRRKDDRQEILSDQAQRTELHVPAEERLTGGLL